MKEIKFMQQLEIIKRTNKRVMIASFLLILLAISGYVMEYTRGTRTLAYVVLISLSLLAPILFSFVCYRMPRFTESFKRIALYSFIVSWMIMLTFSPKVIQFTLIFPLIIIYVLYYDIKLIRNASVIILIYGIFKVLLNSLYYKMTDSFMSTEYTVFILSLIAFGLVTSNTISFSIKIRNQQLESIIEEKEKNAQLLIEMKEVVDVIQRTTKGVYTIYGDLIETSDQASHTIKQLSHGMNDIADSLSSQCDNSYALQQTLLQTTDKSIQVVDKTNHSTDQIHSGKSSFIELDNFAGIIKQNSDDAYHKMLELDKTTSEIKSIIDLIQKIAVQTNMLALNAAIESARAGEAGKGFTVVAESIRELATRTSQSLEGINHLIEQLETRASESLHTAEDSLRVSDTIQSLIHHTKDIFDEIDRVMTDVNNGITETVKTNEEVVHNNQAVVDQFSKISNAVKEAALHAGQASEKVEDNKVLTLKAKAYMDELAQLVEKI